MSGLISASRDKLTLDSDRGTSRRYDLTPLSITFIGIISESKRNNQYKVSYSQMINVNGKSYQPTW